jgi:hypothetical protein
MEGPTVKARATSPRYPIVASHTFHLSVTIFPPSAQRAQYSRWIQFSSFSRVSCPNK